MGSKQKIYKSSGFTLIELLVVVAIIGLLSSVVLASLNSARAKARDAKKREDFNSIRSALLLYYDTYGSNPINRNPCCGYPDISSNFLQELVTAKYLGSNPISPTSPSVPYYYYDYGPNNNIGMILVTALEAAPVSTTGLPGSCRPWTPGANWCDQSNNTYYCICIPY